MRSGNGRHRRPRQAPAIVVAAGVTGSALALPLLGAGSASAVDATTWDRVAECESGGSWSIDMGNGYYGGLQLSQETWDAYGGTQYALRPDLASRAQQIAVAEKVYAATGVKAWETCAPIAGLGTAGGTTGASPEVTPEKTVPAPDPAESADPLEPSDPAAPATPADPVESLLPTEPAESRPTERVEPTEPVAPGTGKHRGEPDPAESDGVTGPAAPEGENTTSDDNSVTERENDGHASRGDGTTREPAVGESGASEDPGSYTVRPGDNLSVIADAHELPGGWTALYESNRETVGEDPDLIVPGQSLDLTPAEEQPAG
jgi:hypothetical protein